MATHSPAIGCALVHSVHIWFDGQAQRCASLAPCAGRRPPVMGASASVHACIEAAAIGLAGL